jgi:hypothetical protein
MWKKAVVAEFKPAAATENRMRGTLQRMTAL